MAHLIVKLPDGPEVRTRNFTLDTMITIEEHSGGSWYVLDITKGKVAREVLRAAYRYTGLSPKEAEAEAAKLTLEQLQTVFEIDPDDKPLPESGDGEASDVPLGLRSSSGGQGASAGRQRKRAASA